MEKIIKEISIVVAAIEERIEYYDDKADNARTDKYNDYVVALTEAKEAIEEAQSNLEGL